jgi:hypothetical protein
MAVFALYRNAVTYLTCYSESYIELPFDSQRSAPVSHIFLKLMLLALLGTFVSLRRHRRKGMPIRNRRLNNRSAREPL